MTSTADPQVLQAADVLELARLVDAHDRALLEIVPRDLLEDLRRFASLTLNAASNGEELEVLLGRARAKVAALPGGVSYAKEAVSEATDSLLDRSPLNERDVTDAIVRLVEDAGEMVGGRFPTRLGGKPVEVAAPTEPSAWTEERRKAHAVVGLLLALDSERIGFRQVGALLQGADETVHALLADAIVKKGVLVRRSLESGRGASGRVAADVEPRSWEELTEEALEKLGANYKRSVRDLIKRRVV